MNTMSPQAVLKDCTAEQLAPTLRAMAGDYALMTQPYAYRTLAGKLAETAEALASNKITHDEAVARGVAAWDQLDDDSQYLD